MSGEYDNNYSLLPQQEENIKTIKDNKLSIFQMAVGVFGHEIGHTNKNNASQIVKENAGDNSEGIYGSEFVPQRIQGRILKDLAK